MDTHQARQDTEAPAEPSRIIVEPLLLQQQQQLHLRQPTIAARDDGLRAAEPERRRLRLIRSLPWPTVLGFCFLTFNSGMAIYRARGERRAVAFVAFSYLDLLTLFFCLRKYEIAEPGSEARDRLKIGIWVLTTALTLLFTTKVAAVMPTVVAVVVWLMAFTTVGGAFYAFFCYSDKE